MIVAKNFLSRHELRALADAALRSYDPSSTKLGSMDHGALDVVRCRCQELLEAQLEFFRAFLFLVTETTIETATTESDGWHTDSYCTQISGDCFNVWVPLFNDSSHTGLEVIESSVNAGLYDYLGDNREPMRIVTRGAAPEAFARLGDSDEDMLILKRSLNKAIAVRSHELAVSTFYDPAPGDVAIFKQTDIHRGVHVDGIRVQLSLKFVRKGAAIADEAGHAGPPPERQLSKHGRLEASVMKTLLGLRLEAAGRMPG